jgi:hypothetical protein
MLTIVIILAIGLLPFLFSLLVMRKAELQARERLRTAMHTATTQRFRQLYRYSFSPEHQYAEGIGYFIGDITCQYNARSAHLRCAVNPSGPCETCPHYRSIELN